MEFWSFFWGAFIAFVVFKIYKSYYLAEVLNYPVSSLNQYDDNVDAMCNEVAGFLRARLKGEEYGLITKDDWKDIEAFEDFLKKHQMLHELPEDLVRELLGTHSAHYAIGDPWMSTFFRALHASGCTMIIRQLDKD